VQNALRRLTHVLPTGLLELGITINPVWSNLAPYAVFEIGPGTKRQGTFPADHHGLINERHWGTDRNAAAFLAKKG
jgi:hypothetical protein